MSHFARSSAAPEGEEIPKKNYSPLTTTSSNAVMDRERLSRLEGKVDQMDEKFDQIVTICADIERNVAGMCVLADLAGCTQSLVQRPRLQTTPQMLKIPGDDYYI